MIHGKLLTADAGSLDSQGYNNKLQVIIVRHAALLRRAILYQNSPLAKRHFSSWQDLYSFRELDVGLTLKEYFNIDHKQLADIDQENQSEVEAEAATPSFPNARQTRERPRRNRHKTELEQIIREDKQNSQPKPTHRMVTLSLEELVPVDKPGVKLPAIHELKQRQQPVRPAQRRQIQKRTQESASINLAIFLKKEQGKGSLGKQVMTNARRGIRSRVTSTSFYHMNIRDRMKTEQETDHALEKSFVITRYGALKSGKGKEEALLKKYENSFQLSKH